MKTVHNPGKNQLRTTHQNDNGVVVSEDGFGTYITCNPTKYVKGTNIIQLTRNELLEFIPLLENELEVVTNNWKVTGFDFNQNIYTRYSVTRYLPVFRDKPRYRIVHRDGDGLTYATRSKTTSFSIYDKKKHMGVHREEVPDSFKDRNIMRLEMGVDKNVKNIAKFSNLNTLRDLTDKENYDRIVDQWYKMYRGINKQSIYKVRNLVKPESISLDDFPLLCLINEIGMENYLHLLEGERNNGIYSRNQYTRRREAAIQLWGSYTSSKEGTLDLLQEIDEAMQETVERCKG